MGQYISVFKYSQILTGWWWYDELEHLINAEAVEEKNDLGF